MHPCPVDGFKASMSGRREWAVELLDKFFPTTALSSVPYVLYRRLLDMMIGYAREGQSVTGLTIKKNGDHQVDFEVVLARPANKINVKLII
jgi:hypothetical protein